MKKHTIQSLVLGVGLYLFPTLASAQGSGYSGPYTTSAPIVLTGVSNKTISNLEITNPNGNCITLTNCTNIKIENCKLGPSKGEGVSIGSSTNVAITNCTMEKIRTGVYAVSSSGIAVEYNDVKNVTGPMPRGQMVQFDKVTGNGNSISYNVSENIMGESAPEDIISTYMSSGTATDPIRIAGNWLRGGGPSTSGGGIMAGDNNGAYILVENNILVNPGQYGLSVSGGHDIVVRNNKVYSAKFTFTNIGLFAWNQYTTPSYAITISNNEINFTNKDGVVNNWWNAGNMGTITGWSTNVYNSKLNESVLPTKIIGRASAPGTVTGTTEIKKDIALKVYPNPATDYLTIERPVEIENATAEVYSTTGQKIIDQVLMETSTEINTRNLNTGVYLVKISSNNKMIQQQKIMIKKR